MDYFLDELSAHRFLEGTLWPDGPTCPRCRARGRVGRLDGNSTRLGAYKCYACRRIFSITYGTVFSGSHVPLHKWLQAIYLTDGGAKPVRPQHLGKILNVSHKTAATIQQKLAAAVAAAPPAASSGAVADCSDGGTVPRPEWSRQTTNLPRYLTGQEEGEITGAKGCQFRGCA